LIDPSSKGEYAQDAEPDWGRTSDLAHVKPSRNPIGWSPWELESKQKAVASWLSQHMTERNAVHGMQLLGLTWDGAKALVRGQTFASVGPGSHIEVL
jgi:hypothetical protein